MDQVSHQLKPTISWLIRAFWRRVEYEFDRFSVNNEIGSFAMRAYPARLPFGGINVKNGIGKQVNIKTNCDLMVDTAEQKIQQVLHGLAYLPADENVVRALLCRRKQRYSGLAVHDNDLIHTLECLHAYVKLELDFTELKKEWDAKFQDTVNRLHLRRGVLGVRGSAFDLLCELLTQYGGFNHVFNQQHARAQLRSFAGRRESITSDEFCKAMVHAVKKVTDSNRITFPNPQLVASLISEFGMTPT